jgi:hypothetical protein
VEYITIVMVVAVAVIAIWTAVKPAPVILWVAVLLLDILFAIGAYGHLAR